MVRVGPRDRRPDRPIFELAVLRELERALADKPDPDLRVLRIIRDLIREAEASERAPRSGGPGAREPEQ